MHARASRASLRATTRDAVAPLGLLAPQRRWWWLAAAPALGAGLALAAALTLEHLLPADGTLSAGRADAIRASGLAGAMPSAFLTALPEEVIFRGMAVLLPLTLLTSHATPAWAAAAAQAAGPARSGWARHRAAVVLASASTAVFALLHAPAGGTLNVVVAALVGSGYAAIALASGSLWPAVLMHGWYDLALFVIILHQ